MGINQKGAFILILFLYSTLTSAHTTDIIKIRTIGFTPYGINTNGKLSGIYYDIANQIVTGAGYISHNSVAPYARIIREIQAGKIDMTIMFRYPELEDYVEYIAPLPSLKIVVIGLKHANFNDISDLNGKKIIYLRGAKFSNKIDNNDRIVKYPIKTFVQGIKMLIAGRADAIIGPLDPIRNAAVQTQGTTLGKPFIVDQRTPWLQISNKSSMHFDSNKLKQSFLQLQKQDMLRP